VRGRPERAQQKEKTMETGKLTFSNPHTDGLTKVGSLVKFKYLSKPMPK
jgi:hypothetical protein